jgi:hypothetical protein
LLANSAALAPDGQENQAQKTWDGNRTTPVHLIPLKDEFDQQIVPTESSPLPISARFSCEPCHDYDVIQTGLHFNAASGSHPGRPGEPWIWVDEKTGTLLPLSYRRWKGTWHPEDIGLTPWDFTLLFGRHLAGGGIAEPAEETVTPGSRWEVSGRIEINCLGCHNASNIQDPSEWAKQVLRQNFRWAATAAAGLGEVGGMASRLTGTWDIIDGPNPDDTEWAVPPYVRYNRTLFDSKHRAFLDIVHQPFDSRCLACHSATPLGTSKSAFEEDVHSRAGLKCASCHRNDIRHAMVRGYEGEAEDTQGMGAEDVTCFGCHLGNAEAKGAKALAGRLGAPYPRHKGFPAVHFKRLSCTVCHAGPWPDRELTRIRTSRANRLGIYGIARWSTDLPAIIEPVYLREKNGKLTPHRLLWPAFWAEDAGGTLHPLPPDRVLAAGGAVLSPEQSAVNILTGLTLGLELQAGQTPVLVRQGKVYELNLDGGLDASPSPGQNQDETSVWALRQNGTVTPLIPEFDPGAGEIDPEIQAQVQKILEALAGLPGAPGTPILLNQKALFRITETYLEKLQSPAEPAAVPQLAWLVENQVRPLVSDFELRTVAALSGSEQTLTEEQVELVLRALGQVNPEGKSGTAAKYVYVSGGRLFRLEAGGKLDSIEDASAEPVTWPLAHEVRPARQSLGINGCTDCHKAGSAFLFRKVKGTGPLQTARVKTASANSFMRLDKPYQFLFGLSFAVRPLFKWVLFLTILLAGSTIFLVFLLALGRRTGLIEKRK